MQHKKQEVIRARVTDKIKRAVDELADLRDENEAVIVREAVTFYLSAIGTRSGPRSQIRTLLEQSRELAGDGDHAPE